MELISKGLKIGAKEFASYQNFLSKAISPRFRKQAINTASKIKGKSKEYLNKFEKNYGGKIRGQYEKFVKPKVNKYADYVFDKFNNFFQNDELQFYFIFHTIIYAKNIQRFLALEKKSLKTYTKSEVSLKREYMFKQDNQKNFDNSFIIIRILKNRPKKYPIQVN